MSFAFFALAILWSAAIGHRVARALSARLSFEEKLAWGLGVGLVLQAGIYAILLLFRIEPRPIPMVLCGLPFALAAGLAGTGLRRPSERLPRAAVAMLVVAFCAWVIFLLQSVVEPMWANDFIAIWGFKAKTIYLSSSIPSRLFRDPATAWSHPEYPFLLPLFFAALSALAGSWNDHALALLYPALSAAIALLLFGFLRRRGRPLGGALAALLVMLFFPLFQAFEVGMGEIPLAFAILLLATSASDLVDEPNAPTAIRVAFAASLCCGIKQEGTLFVLLLAAAMGLHVWRLRRRLRPDQSWLLLPLTLVGPAVLHWAVQRAARGTISDRDYDLSLLSAGKISSLVARLSVAAAAAGGRLWPIAIPAAAGGLYLLLTPRSRLDWLLPVAAVQIVAYVAICALSSIDPAWQAQFIPRISLVLFPMLCAVLGERADPLFTPSSSVKVREK